MKISVLFNKETREEIVETCKLRTDGYMPSEEFHTEGQVFEDVDSYSTSGGLLQVLLPAKEGGKPTAYMYPTSTIARIKLED